MKETESIRSLKGVGEKTEALFHRLGIYSVGDLLHDYPRDYDVFRKPVSIAETKDQEKVAVVGTIAGNIDVKKVRNLTVISTTIADQTGQCKSTWFNMPFLRSTLRRGMVMVFRGKITIKNGRCQMEHPEIYTPAAYEEKLNSMQPIYSLTAGMTNSTLTKMVREVLEHLDLSYDYLPEEIRLKDHLAEYNFAIEQIHFPGNQECYLEARRRLAYDEFLLFILDKS